MPRNLGVDNMLQRVTELMHNQFGLKPKGQGFAYKCPYPKWYDRVILPARYRILDFTKFTGSNGVSTIEHISRYVTRLRECSIDQAYKVQFFALSLSRLAFTSFSSLPEGSVKNWTDLEKKFHKYFFIRTGEKKITDLMATKQKNNESGLEFLQRFRETKNLCFLVNCLMTSWLPMLLPVCHRHWWKSYSGQPLKIWAMWREQYLNLVLNTRTWGEILDFRRGLHMSILATHL